jgi:TatD DNase family protein
MKTDEISGMVARSMGSAAGQSTRSGDLLTAGSPNDFSSLAGHMTDSHCHLDFKHFDKDRETVMNRARDAGVSLMINSGVDLSTNRKTLQLAKQYGFIKATLGLSPNSTDRLGAKELNELIDHIKANASVIVGVGEAGLDYYRCSDTALRSKQEAAFKRMIDLAVELDKPLVIHARDTEPRVFEMVKHLDKVVFHCYSGNMETMKSIVQRGFYVSIATIVCRSVQHQAVARQVPIDQLLVETDSPFLSPRKGRNEPAFLIDSIRLIARLRGISAKELAEATTRNTRRIYGI